MILTPSQGTPLSGTDSARLSFRFEPERQHQTLTPQPLSLKAHSHIGDSHQRARRKGAENHHVASCPAGKYWNSPIEALIYPFFS